jgi:hypothetical protein
MRFQSLSQLTSRPVTWLWPHRLALGKLAILDGDPGLGKSLVALDLCARLSTGRPFPDGSPGPGPAGIIVLNGEDGAEDVICPRLQALGADLERVYVLQRDGGADSEPLTFPGQTAALDEALRQTWAKLVVIDPIVAFLDPNVLNGSDQSVRRALLPLAELAEKHGCVVLLIRHLNKRDAGPSVYRGGGSIGFIGACRSGWLIARDPHHPARRVLAQVKNNLAPPQPSLAFEVHAPGNVPPTLHWLGPSTWAADHLVARRPVRPCDRARDFLAAILKEGPRTSREIWSAAREQKLARRTLQRAMKDLEIQVKPVTGEGACQYYWLLPNQRLSDHLPPETQPADLEPWLAPLRERFPPSTPLDDL